jgi:hypothetical protein
MKNLRKLTWSAPFPTKHGVNTCCVCERLIRRNEKIVANDENENKILRVHLVCAKNAELKVGG